MSRGKHRKRPVAAVCSALGTVLLIMIVAVCLPLTVPRVFGIHIYTVVSGSMEPAIPTGSLVYVREVPPEETEKDDVIAFYSVRDTGAIITHRVVANSTNMGQFITKGDANETKDMDPVPYDNYIGKVVLSVPVVGGIAQLLASLAGKVAAASLIGIAVLLHASAWMIEKHGERQDGKKRRKR